jgi:hypothetical protein
MIPEFEHNGYLPPGIHPATFDEIEARFGRDSELRRVQAESLRWLVELAKRAGASRLILNGSFVTDASEPNDVDCVLLIGPDFPADALAADELLVGLPFLELNVVEAADFSFLVSRVFATDRDQAPKGVIELIL